MAESRKPQGREVLFEVMQIGSILKINAVDAETGVEISVQGPAASGVPVLKQVALRKLRYVLEKRGQV